MAGHTHEQGTTGHHRTTGRFRQLILRLINRIPVPDLGPWGPVIGIGGLFAGTLALSALVGVMLHTLIGADVLNPFRQSDGSPTATPNATPNPEFLAPTLAVAGEGSLDDSGRITMLLLGADRRPEEYIARPRTDTIMLLMIDPEVGVASILSIPRDLYVEIPGYGLNRVNTAYVLGGGDLAMQTIEYNLGVQVDHYALIDFEGFITLVDEIGGIDIYVPATINDTSYPDMDYGYDPFYIEAGQHHLDGETALKYARTRHADNDFYRAERQQAVLFAIRDRVLSLNLLPQLIQRAPALYSTLSDSIQTNFTLDQMIELAGMVQDIERDNIRSGVIDSDYTVGYVTPEGAQVLIPDRDKIGPLLDEVFWLEGE